MTPSDTQRLVSTILAAVALALGGYMLGCYLSEKRDSELVATMQRQLSGTLTPLEQKMQAFDARLGQMGSTMVTQETLGTQLDAMRPALRRNVEEAVKKYGLKPEQITSAVGNIVFSGSGLAAGECDATKGSYSFSVKPGAPNYADVGFTNHCTTLAQAKLNMRLQARFDQVVLTQDPARVGYLKSGLTSISLVDGAGNLITDATLDPSSSFRYIPDNVPATQKRLLIMGTYSNYGYGAGAYWRMKKMPLFVGGGYERNQSGAGDDRVYIGIALQF